MPIANRTKIDTTSNDTAKTQGSSPQSPQTVRHPLYYKESKDVYILVGHVYFRLPSTDFPRSFFEKFAGREGLGASIDTWPGIGAPENAIYMTEDETKPEEFEKLAWALHNPLIDDFSAATLDDWLDISRLAHRWGFDKLTAMAIRHIKEAETNTPDMSPVERVYKYELNNPPAELVEDLYVKICTREEGLSDAEWDRLDSLGGNQGRQVHRAREALLKARVRGRLDNEQKKSIVREVLGLGDRKTTNSSPPPAQIRNAAATNDHYARFKNEYERQLNPKFSERYFILGR
ncbi:hypothetical protein H1R20_g10215, partial [Candolleomyces eurysporus]